MGYTIKEIREWVKENPPKNGRYLTRVMPIRNFDSDLRKYYAANYRGMIQKISGLFYTKNYQVTVLKDGVVHNDKGPAKVFISNKRKNFGKIFAGQYLINGKPIPENDLRFELFVRRDHGQKYNIDDIKWISTVFFNIKKEI